MYTCLDFDLYYILDHDLCLRTGPLSGRMDAWTGTGHQILIHVI